jgi:hypothetical protein
MVVLPLRTLYVVSLGLRIVAEASFPAAQTWSISDALHIGFLSRT